MIDHQKNIQASLLVGLANVFRGDIFPGQFGPGQAPKDQVIECSNVSLFESAHYSKDLQQYVVGGWDRDPLQEFLEFFAPAVPVPDRFNYKATQWADYFLRLSGDEDIRPMGSQFGKIDPARRVEIDDRLDEKGLTIAVDKRDMEADPMAREKAVDRVRRILLRTEIRRAIALHIATSVNTAKTWNASADPDQDVADEMLDVENAIGVRPTRVGYGSLAWARRQKSIRGGDKAGNFASAGWTAQQVSDYIGASAMSITEARYRETISALGTVIGNLVFFFNAEGGLGRDDPSNIKRFVGNVAGERVAVYEQDFPRHVELTVAHKSKTRITSTLGMRRLTVTGF